LLPLKVITADLADALDDFHACFERPKFVPIEHMQLRAAAKFSGEFVKRRLKIIFPEENT